ncbi:MAG: hypothetical protein ACI8ZX_003058 [Planctomycetota bacterium]|jgi:hypothetical protein
MKYKIESSYATGFFLNLVGVNLRYIRNLQGSCAEIYSVSEPCRIKNKISEFLTILKNKE